MSPARYLAPANASIFPFMHTFIDALVERNFQNKTIGLIENGTWAPLAAKIMKEKFANSKNITFLDPVVRINSAEMVKEGKLYYTDETPRGVLQVKENVNHLDSSLDLELLFNASVLNKNEFTEMFK